MSEPRCSLCEWAWSDEPGTVYCSAQHGACGLCNKPRAAGSCRCMTSTAYGAVDRYGDGTGCRPVAERPGLFESATPHQESE